MYSGASAAACSSTKPCSVRSPVLSITRAATCPGLAILRADHGGLADRVTARAAASWTRARLQPADVGSRLLRPDPARRTGGRCSTPWDRTAR